MYTIAVQLSCNWGLGRHYEYLALASVHQLFNWVYVSLACCIIAPMLGRVSFILYLLAILGKARRPVLSYSLWGALVLQAASNIALILVIYGECGTNTESIMK